MEEEEAASSSYQPRLEGRNSGGRERLQNSAPPCKMSRWRVRIPSSPLLTVFEGLCFFCHCNSVGVSVGSRQEREIITTDWKMMMTIRENGPSICLDEMISSVSHFPYIKTDIKKQIGGGNAAISPSLLPPPPSCCCRPTISFPSPVAAPVLVLSPEFEN